MERKIEMNFLHDYCLPLTTFWIWDDVSLEMIDYNMKWFYPM